MSPLPNGKSMTKHQHFFFFIAWFSSYFLIRKLDFKIPISLPVSLLVRVVVVFVVVVFLFCLPHLKREPVVSDAAGLSPLQWAALAFSITAVLHSK